MSFIVKLLLIFTFSTLTVVQKPEEVVEPTFEEETIIIVEQEIEEPAQDPVQVEPSLEYQAFFSATFRIETGNGTSWLWKNANNPGGIKCWGEPGESCTSGNYKIFPSQEAGLEALEQLLQGYWTKYGMDFKSYRDRYCACGGNDLKNFTAIFNEELKKLGGRQ